MVSPRWSDDPDAFAVALTGEKLAIIFIHECDTLLSARREQALIVKQLAQEKEGQVVEREEIEWVVSETEGRSAVNMERVVSSAMLRAGVLPVTLADFEEALEEEPSDYDAEVAKRNRDFNKKHGWRRKC